MSSVLGRSDLAIKKCISAGVLAAIVVSTMPAACADRELNITMTTDIRQPFGSLLVKEVPASATGPLEMTSHA